MSTSWAWVFRQANAKIWQLTLQGPFSKLPLTMVLSRQPPAASKLQSCLQPCNRFVLPTSLNRCELRPSENSGAQEPICHEIVGVYSGSLGPPIPMLCHPNSWLAGLDSSPPPRHCLPCSHHQFRGENSPNTATATSVFLHIWQCAKPGSLPKDCIFPKISTNRRM